MPFAVIPGAALVAIQLGMPDLVIWGCVEGVAVMLLSYGVGYFAGSLAPKAGRNPTLRMLSMLAWFMLFGAWLLFRFAENLKSYPILGLIPPFSFARASLGEPISIISSLAFLAISALTYLYGSSRLWNVLRMASSLTVSAPQKAWKLWRFAAPLLKDLKLLGRNPRMLASTLYFMFLGPLFFIYPEIQGEPATALSFLAGGVGGYAVEYIYMVEGSSARFLYLLPVSKKDLIRMKALTLIVLGLIIALGIALVIASVTEPLTGLSAGLTYLLSLSGSALLNSFVVSSQLPKEPSSWTHETFSGLILLLAFLGITTVYGLLVAICFLQPYLDTRLLAPLLALLPLIAGYALAHKK